MAVPLGGAALGLRGGGRRTYRRGCRGPALHRAAGPLQGPGCSTGAFWQGLSPWLRIAPHTMEGLASGAPHSRPARGISSTPHRDHWPPNAGRGQAPNTLLPPCCRLSKDVLVPSPARPSHRADGDTEPRGSMPAPAVSTAAKDEASPRCRTALLSSPPAPVTHTGNQDQSPWDTQRLSCLLPHTHPAARINATLPCPFQRLWMEGSPRRPRSPRPETPAFVEHSYQGRGEPSREESRRESRRPSLPALELQRGWVVPHPLKTQLKWGLEAALSIHSHENRSSGPKMDPGPSQRPPRWPHCPTLLPPV